MNTHGVRALASAAFLISLTGCGMSALSTRAMNPVIDHTVTEGGYYFGKPLYGVLSTTAGRRSTFVKYKENGETDICSEAPPDAIDAYADALSAAAQGSVPSGPGAQLSVSKSFAVSSGLGLYRSQGLQYLRDQSFSLCLMLVNKHIEGPEWIRMHDEAVARSERLIQLEMEAIKSSAARAPLIVSAGNGPISTAPSPSTTAPSPSTTAPSPSGQASKISLTNISPLKH